MGVRRLACAGLIPLMLWTIAALWAAPPAVAVTDGDGDGIADLEETELAAAFAPDLVYDEDEHNPVADPARAPIAEGADVDFYYQVTRAKCDGTKKEIVAGTQNTVLTIVAVYEYDYVPVKWPTEWTPLWENDYLAHYGDAEMMRICFQRFTSQPTGTHVLAYPYGNVWYRPLYVIASRHGVEEEWRTRGQVWWPNTTTTHMRLYVSEGKHAFYFGLSQCEDSSGDAPAEVWREDCGGGVTIRPEHLASGWWNVGESTAPKVTEIRGLFGGERPESVWGVQQRFCGGHNVASPDGSHGVVALGGIGYTQQWCGGSLGSKWLKPPASTLVTVATAALTDADTSANVYLDLYGSSGAARYVYLDGWALTAGSVNTYSVNASGIGVLQKVCVYHDNSGSSPSWSVDYVQVGATKYTFGNQWLDTGHRLWACRPTDTWPSGVWAPYDTTVASAGQELFFYDRTGTVAGKGYGRFFNVTGTGGMESIRLYDTMSNYWTTIVPVEYDGDVRDELLFYGGTYGGFNNVSTSGALTETARGTTYHDGWDLIVPLQIDGDAASELLFYDRNSPNPTKGHGGFYDVKSPAGGIATIKTYDSFSNYWTIIIPVEFDGDGGDELFFLGGTLGLFLDVSSGGVLSETSRSTTLHDGWDIVVPLQIDDDPESELFFYDRSSPTAGQGHGGVYNVEASAGGLASIRVFAAGLSNAWTALVPIDVDGDGKDELGFYESSTALAGYYDVSPAGLMTRINAVDIFRAGYDMVVPVELGG